MKVDNLSGAALDWAVAECEGWDRLRPNPHKFNQALIMSDDRGDSQFLSDLNYSTNWAQGGPIIEREAVNWYRNNKRGFPSDDRRWEAHITLNHDEEPILRVQYRGRGATQLVAAMRCYVASKLGDDIDIPEELL